MQWDDHKHIKIVYHILRKDKLCTPTCTNGCSHLKHVLQLLGFLDNWKYQTVGNSQLFLM